MSTFFIGEGNIGSPAEFREFANGNDEPHRLLRLNVRFDNPVPVKAVKGKEEYQDRGGFWAPVEIWHPHAEHWANLYQRGMRVLVQGRMTCQEWDDAEGQKQVTFKVEARRIGILPQRVKAIEMEASGTETQDAAPENIPDQEAGQKKPKPSGKTKQAS